MKELYRSLVAIFFFGILLCGLYPLLVYAIGEMLFHDRANGSLLSNKGSKLIAVDFTEERYFKCRPSEAHYDGAHSQASNLGPTSKKLFENVKKNLVSYRRDNGLSPEILIPIDAVTTSGSGLDPHISVENALLQAPRVAKARNLDEVKLKKIIEIFIENKTWGFLGLERINVFELNLYLDEKHL